MGYLAQKKKEKRVSVFTYFSLALLFLLSLGGIAFRYSHLSMLMDEFRLQYIVCGLLFIVYSLIRRRFWASFLFALLVVFNMSVIVSQNQILAKEYAGKNPTTFTVILHRMDEGSPNITEIEKPIARHNPDIAVIYMNRTDIDVPQQGYDSITKEVFGDGEIVFVLSNIPYGEKLDILDDQGDKIAVLLYFPGFPKPFSLIVMDMEKGLSPESMQLAISRMEAVMETINGRDEPVLLAGGFSYSPWSSIFDRLKKESFKTQAGFRPEYPKSLPCFMRLSRNYIFTHPGTSVIGTELIDGLSSPYKPLLMTVAIDARKQR